MLLKVRVLANDVMWEYLAAVWHGTPKGPPPEMHWPVLGTGIWDWG